MIEAANGQSAIDAVTRDHPDLILQDLLLPDLDGFELVHRLHELITSRKGRRSWRSWVSSPRAMKEAADGAIRGLFV